jgi:Sigma-70, region 4/Anti-sigma-K factor rskA
MTELDRLPPDQRAVLSLVLDRGKSYTEVAELLGIPEGAVRERAHAALDALADDTAVAGGARGTSARGASADVPSTPVASRFAPASVEPEPTARSASATPPARPREPRRPQTSAGSRRAGALLLGAIVVVIVVAVVLITNSGGKGSTPTTTSAGTSTSTTGTSSTSTASGAKPSLNNTIQLTSTEPSLKASGTAYVLSEGGRYAFYVTAQGLPPSSGFFYAVWLYNSPSSAKPLGRASNVTSNGRMDGGNPLPTGANDYAKFIVTRETSTHPSQPGPTVLSGAFSLH